ncbi:PDZK1-interacting protein 1 [Spea bombifrons]|uniref:PDZK1-interacting protein 1 n=1 Tax=Spea bombifrons TaxID=233779 RepID=UPI00234B22CD|nr:PDZK1-interacting protein 1 [Spea bombifrons]
MLSLQLAFFFLVTLGQVCCQPDQRSANLRKFPQWLTGLIAVAVFLFLVLVVYVANRVWNRRTQDIKDPDMAMKSTDEDVTSNGTYHQYRVHDVRSSEHDNAYENPIEVTDNVLSTAM